MADTTRGTVENRYNGGQRMMTNEEEKTQSSQEPIKGQETTPTTNPITEAIKAAERLEKANEVKTALLDREEAIVARRALGGQSEAGTQAKKKAPETDKEFTEKFLNGDVDLLE